MASGVSTINVKTLRKEMGRIIKRVGKGEDFTILYRSRPAFRILPLSGYRDLLEGAFMIRVLRPQFANLDKRLVKSPKVYLRDSGVLYFLLGLEETHELAVHPVYGVRAGAWHRLLRAGPE